MYVNWNDLYVSQLALASVSHSGKAVEELFGLFFGLAENSFATELVQSKCDSLVTVLFTKQYINNDHWLLSI